MPIREPVQVAQPLRRPGDLAGTRVMTNWAAGYNRRKLEDYYLQAQVPPQFWDAKNICWWKRQGYIFLAARSYLIESDAADKGWLWYPFNNALYRLWTNGTDPGAANRIRKITSAAGTPVTAALTNNYPGTAAPANAVNWRDQFVVAPNENLLRVMSTSEVWTTIAAPGGVAGVAQQVGIGPDDRLVAWWKDAGLYGWDGSTWAKVWPTTATNVAVEPNCDLIARGAGSTIFATRDASGRTTLIEWFIEPTGTGFYPFLSEPGLRVWPQGADSYDEAMYVVGRLGAGSNQGFLLRKEYRQPPELLDILDTAGYTAGQETLDWSFRCIRSVGDAVWIGASSRFDHDACLYRYFIDENGQVIGPGAAIDAVAGPIYSIGVLPPSATSATGSERLHLSVAAGTYYKDEEGGSDPTKDALTGWIQFPDIDFGTDDREKQGRVAQAFVSEKSTGGTIEAKHRVNPGAEDVARFPWTSLGLAIAEGLKNWPFPDDNAALNEYGTYFRNLQTGIWFTAATSGTKRDTVDMFLVDVSSLRPVVST